MSRAGVSNGNGLYHRLRAFFLANPDEELSYDDIVVKFEATRHTAQMAVSRLNQTGLLESVHVIRLRAKGTMR